MILLTLLCLIGPSLTLTLHPLHSSHFRYPHKKYENGSTLTFFFKHIKNREDRDEGGVRVNFNEKQRLDDDKDDITAHFRLDMNTDAPVVTSSFINRGWLSQQSRKQKLIEYPPMEGWWRLDLVKLSKNHLGVFFQGYWAGIRTFGVSLDKSISIHVDSMSVDHDNLHLVYTPPHAHRKLDYHNFVQTIPIEPIEINSIFYGGFPHFAIGDFLHMILYLRPFGQHTEPEVHFNSKKSGKPIFKIMQSTFELFLVSHEDDRKTRCNIISGKKTGIGGLTAFFGGDGIAVLGDLAHIRLMRSGEAEVHMTMYYANDLETVSCSHHVPNLSELNRGFNVFGAYGGVPISMSFGKDDTIELKREF